MNTSDYKYIPTIKINLPTKFRDVVRFVKEEWDVYLCYKILCKLVLITYLYFVIYTQESAGRNGLEYYFK